MSTTSAARRVVITGMGLISPMGSSPSALWNALTSGQSGVGPLQCWPADQLPVAFAAEARQFTGKIDDFGQLENDQKRNIRKGLKVMCREIQMGVAASQLALQDAGLKPGSYDSERTGSVFGSDYILTEPQEFLEGIRSCLTPERTFDFSRWAEDGMPKVTPLWLLKYLPNMPASHVAIYNDLRGPSNSITLREASANLAVAEAYCSIVRGNADVMVVGATGTRLHPLRTIHVLLQEEVASDGDEPQKLSRPFDRDRRGMVLGEGAGAVIVEDLKSAEARGAKILAEIVGFGSSAVLDRHGVADLARALENVLRQAIRKSGLSPAAVGHVHAHGLSTRHADRQEAAAIGAVFGQRSAPIPVTAAKSYMGNLGAGAGMVELISSVLALQDGRLFPILNYQTPDPECPIAAVRTLDTPAGESFVNLSVTPQGQASSVLIRRAI